MHNFKNSKNILRALSTYVYGQESSELNKTCAPISYALSSQHLLKALYFVQESEHKKTYIVEMPLSNTSGKLRYHENSYNTHN